MKLIEKFKRMGRKPHQPERETDIYPRLMQVLAGQRVSPKTPVFKPTPWNLRAFSKTPYARRAINTIKNPITQLDWEIVPRPGIKENSLLLQQADTVAHCLRNPNNGESWRTFLERVIEDTLCGAGAFEKQFSGDAQRPVFLFSVDGLSIQVYPLWQGNKDEARYCQVPGYGTVQGGGVGIDLRDDELSMIMPNPSTSTPFGAGPLEVAFTTIARLLGAGEYAGNLATNARPTSILNFDKLTDEQLSSIRSYWTNEIEGQGKMPIMNGGDAATVLKLTAEGDKALYLEWQEFLKVEIATAFDISPQNLGVERDVNRSTGEVAEDRDWDQAIKPMAALIEDTISHDVINMKLGFSQLRFRFKGLDREDEKASAEIKKIYYDMNVFTPNEIREKMGEAPMDNEWGDLCFADVQVALQAAHGAAQVDDPAIGSTKKPAKKKAKDKEG